MHLSGGERHDGPEGRLSIEKIGTDFEGVPILMDRAYEGDKTRELARLYGHEPVVPPKKNRIDPWEYDTELYKKRNMVERLFRWLKEFRKICTRYDKTDMMYLAFIQFACIIVWIKQCQQALDKDELNNLLTRFENASERVEEIICLIHS